MLPADSGRHITGSNCLEKPQESKVTALYRKHHAGCPCGFVFHPRIPCCSFSCRSNLRALSGFGASVRKFHFAYCWHPQQTLNCRSRCSRLRCFICFIICARRYVPGLCPLCWRCHFPCLRERQVAYGSAGPLGRLDLFSAIPLSTHIIA